jgi:hypothetical protein
MRKKKETYGLPTYSKNNKGKSKSQHSILHKHELKLKEFSKQQEKLNALDSKIRSLQLLIKKQNEECISKPNKESINLSNLLKTNKLNLEKLKDERKIIENTQDQIDYILESSLIMQQYIELEEREQILLTVNDLSDENSIELNEISVKKNEIVNTYMCKFDPDYKPQKRYFSFESVICKECNIPYSVEKSFLVCRNCGICNPTVEQATELSYKELQDFDYRPQFTYDKMTHLEDWLRRFQAKENRSIPQEILDKVILEAKKARVQNLNILTEDQIKRYLKRLNLNDYYDNVIGIINRINGRPPFTLTSEVEDKIKTMFQQIQDPYEKFKPSGRKNFLSYSYTLHKFFQILGLHEFAKYFPLLKSTDKLRQQDDIFKKIVGFMSQKDPTTKWVFYPSI